MTREGALRGPQGFPDPSGLLYGLDDFPSWPRALIYGLQWAVIFLPTLSIISTILTQHLGLPENEKVLFFQRILIVTGGMMILQTLWGHRYPLLDGPASALLLSFMVLAPHGIETIQGSMIIGGLLLAALSALGLMQYLDAYFTDNVIGVILLLIAITLLPYLAPLFIGVTPASPHGDPLVFGISCLVMLGIALFSHWFRGFPKTIALFLGIAAGTLAMWALGRTDAAGVEQAPWLSFPSPLFSRFPRFSFGATSAFLVAYVAVVINTVGSIYGVGEVVGKEGMAGRVKRGMVATGFGSIVSGALGVIGTVSYSISPGVVLVTRVGSRFTVTVCGTFLFALAFFQKLLALLVAVPAAVVGAAMVSAMAAQVGAGVAVLTRSRNPLSGRDYMVIGVPLLMGGLVSILPEEFFQAFPSLLHAFIKNGLAVGVVLVLLLEHLFLPRRK